MAEAIVEFFRNLFGNDLVTTFVVAAVPLVELRGAIPVAFMMGGLSWWQIFLAAYVGSCLICPLLYWLLRPVLNLLKRIKCFGNFVAAVEQYINEKAQKAVRNNENAGKKVKFWGVVCFVGVPLPLTGAWTGTAIAVFLEMGFLNTLLSVCLGNLIAASVITLLSVFFLEYIDVIIYCLIAIIVVVLVSLIVKLIIKSNREKERKDK
ncbi:MAG: COG2426 family protein [Christensenellales bacterium]